MTGYSLAEICQDELLEGLAPRPLAPTRCVGLNELPEALGGHLRRKTVEVGLIGIVSVDPVGEYPGSPADLDEVVAQQIADKLSRSPLRQMKQVTRSIEPESLIGHRIAEPPRSIPALQQPKPLLEADGRCHSA